MSNQEYWKKMWQKKGEIVTSDVQLLDGFEDVKVPSNVLARKIMNSLSIKHTDKVLEVGCGAGMIARHVSKKCQYYGIDITESLLTKHRELLNNNVIIAEANDIPFKDNYFDKSFSYSVFHYFPDITYVWRVIEEMKRVTKGHIFIGDLPRTSKRKEHLLFTVSDFGRGIITEGYHCKERFNVLKWQEYY